MEETTEQLRVRDFAARAGVTVRTLHLYDRLGLLKPAGRTDAGYRYYGETELERLEQILALRFVGFSLDRIKELLCGSRWPLVVAMRMQREIMAQQRRRLQTACDALDQAERVLTNDPSADRWETLRTVMEAFKMDDEWNWTKNYFTSEDREKLERLRESTPREVVERGERDWAALIADVEAAVSDGTDPSSERARQLAKRWKDLVAQFTRGDRGIHDGLNRMWSDRQYWPKDFKRPWSDPAGAFIKKAMQCASP